MTVADLMAERRARRRPEPPTVSRMTFVTGTEKCEVRSAKCEVPESEVRSPKCGVRSPSLCGLRTLDFESGAAHLEPRSDFGTSQLRTSDFGLRTSDFALRTSDSLTDSH